MVNGNNYKLDHARSNLDPVAISSIEAEVLAAIPSN